ncbi:transposase [Streptomyces luteogriseus]|uniref:transposase n=1 Tax=Streptomyces luteogriseus TaxID=68233 RepID=UPI0036EB1149
MKQSRALQSLKWLQSQLDDFGLMAMFDTSVENVAEHLDAATTRVDYANRRVRMADYSLSVADWLVLLDGLPRLERLRNAEDSTIGSVLLWSGVTQGERMCSPAAERMRRQGKSTQELSSQLTRMTYMDSRGSRLRLMRRLELYSGLLANACDEGLDLRVSASGCMADEPNVGSRITNVGREAQVTAPYAAPIALTMSSDRIPCNVGDRADILSDSVWRLFEGVALCGESQRLRRTSDRDALAAILFVATSGCSWNKLPPYFVVSAQTAFRRFSEWSDAGVWQPFYQAVLDAATDGDDLGAALDSIQMVMRRSARRGHSKRASSTNCSPADD